MRIITMIKTVLVCIMMTTTFSAMSASADIEFRAQISVDCSFLEFDHALLFGGVTPGQVFNKSKVAQHDFSTNCSGGGINAKFYLTPTMLTTIGTDVDNIPVLVPVSKPNMGIRVALSFGSGNTFSTQTNLGFDSTTALTLSNVSLANKKMRMTATLVPLAGITQVSSIPPGEFSASATLNIIYF